MYKRKAQKTEELAKKKCVSSIQLHFTPACNFHLSSTLPLHSDCPGHSTSIPRVSHFLISLFDLSIWLLAAFTLYPSPPSPLLSHRQLSFLSVSFTKRYNSTDILLSSVTLFFFRFPSFSSLILSFFTICYYTFLIISILLTFIILSFLFIFLPLLFTTFSSLIMFSFYFLLRISSVSFLCHFSHQVSLSFLSPIFF